MSHLETVGTAAAIVPDGDVVEDLRVGVDCWVYKADRGLPNCKALLVDAVKDRGEDRGRGEGASDQCGRSIIEYDNVVSDGGHVGVTAAGTIVDASVGHCGSGVVGAGD